MSDLKILAAELIVVLTIALIGSLIAFLVVLGKYRKVRRRERMKLVLLRNLSHEIRTPLHTVSGLGEIIADESLYLSKSEKKNISDQIKNGANLAASLLNEIVVFSEEGAEDLHMHEETISPNFLCMRCVNAHIDEVRSGKLALNFRKELGDDYTVKTDPRALELILTKLIENSLRFTSEGEIEVGCNTTENPGRLTIYVKDSGEGIPEERKDDLFTWFEKPEDMADEAELDLSIAQKLAMRLGGIIRLDNSYKGGTRLVCILPQK